MLFLSEDLERVSNNEMAIGAFSRYLYGPPNGSPTCCLGRVVFALTNGRVVGLPVAAASTSGQDASGSRLLFAPPNKRFMRARRSVLSSPNRTKRLSCVWSRSNALYCIFTWRRFVLSKQVSRESIVCLSFPHTRGCPILMTAEQRCCIRSDEPTRYS